MCDNCTLIQQLYFWTLSSSSFVSFRFVSDTVFCLRLQVEHTQLGPIHGASPYLRPRAPTQDTLFKVDTA
jgi:hypothetical protein